MIRNEIDLLSSLFENLKNETKTKKNVNNEINLDKYRDENGVIDLRNVKDFAEVKRVIDFVDNKNYLEKLANENAANLSTISTMAKNLANDLKELFNAENVEVSVETDEGEAQESSDNNEIKETKAMKQFIGVVNGTEYNTVEEYNKAINEAIKNGSNINAYTETKILSTTDDVVVEYGHADPVGELGDEGIEVIDFDDEDDFAEISDEEDGWEKDDVVVEDDGNKIVVLHCVGGDLFNPQFYNATLFICEREYFNKSGVYAEYETVPDNINVHILLPNTWGKIKNSAAEYFSERLSAGEEVYLIDPETFELVKIHEGFELWDYVMTIVQEQTI